MFRLFLLSSSALSLFAGTALGADIDAPLFGNQFYEAPIEEASVTQPFGGVAGFVDTYYSRSTSEDADFDSNTWGLRGSINAGASGANAQLDGSVGWVDQDGGEATQYSGTAHLYYRPQMDYAVGAFAHLAKTDTVVYGLGGTSDVETKDYLFGAEAGWFTDLASFTLQGGFGKLDADGTEANHLLVGLGMNYFLSDNIRFDSGLNYHRLDVEDLDTTIDVVSLQTTLNYRADDLPVSIYGGYRLDHLTPEVAGVKLDSASTNTFLVGLKGHFGSNSLKDEMRNGPIWTAPTLLP